MLKNVIRSGVTALSRPLLAMRLRYVPLLVVYFAYGALGLIDVTRDMWIKERLTLTPAELAGIGVWLSLPWTVKMVFGELVDSVPMFGSQRRIYIILGALFTASGMFTLAGARDILPSKPSYPHQLDNTNFHFHGAHCALLKDDKRWVYGVSELAT